jgi:hypothetical protein
MSLMESNLGNTTNLPMPEPTAPVAPPASANPMAATPAGPVPTVSTPVSAQDTDRIEHEWILKIRQIQLITRNDPFEQAKQLAALRADYMAKRYNKIIKTGE